MNNHEIFIIGHFLDNNHCSVFLHDAALFLARLLCVLYVMYSVSKKNIPPSGLRHNFGKYFPIFKILSLSDLARNLR